MHMTTAEEFLVLRPSRRGHKDVLEWWDGNFRTHGGRKEIRGA